jgi:hypothetical protein
MISILVLEVVNGLGGDLIKFPGVGRFVVVNLAGVFFSLVVSPIVGIGR